MSFDGRDTVVAALGDDVGGPELEGQLLPGLVATHRDDPLGPLFAGGEHRAQPDRAVTDDGDGHARNDVGGLGREPAGAHHVREGKQVRNEVVVGLVGEADEAALRHRDTDELRLAAAHQLTVQTGGVDSVAAIGARVVGGEERSDHELTRLDRGDVTADGLDDAAVFVAERRGLGHRGEAAVLPEVRAAHAGGGDPDDRVGGSDDLGLGNVFRPHVTGSVDDASSHKAFSFNHFEHRKAHELRGAAGVARPQRHLMPQPIDAR